MTVSGDVSAPVTPTITVTPASLALGTTTFGTASTPAQTYTVSAVNLTSTLDIAAPAGVELSLNNFGTAGVTALSFTPSGGTVASTTIYVRLATSAASGAYSGTITHTSTGANNPGVTVTGTVNGTLSVSAAGPFALGTTQQGTAGTTTASYTLSGAGLSGSVTVTAPTGFEIGTSLSFGGGDANTLTLTPSGGSISQLLYVRLSGTGSGAMSGSISHANTSVPVGSQPSVSVSGTVNVPTILVNPTSLSLGTVALNTAGTISTYTVSGSNLTANLVITPPAGVEISKDGFTATANTTASPLTFVQSAGVVTSKTISVRIASAASAATISGNIANTSASTTTNVTVSGAVSGGTTACVPSQGFDNANSSLPSGFTFTSISTGDTYASDFGVSAPSIKFDATNDRIVTPAVSGPSQLSFWIKGQGTNTTSALLVEGLIGNTPTTIENITNLPNTGTTKTYTAASTGLSNFGSFTNFRFTYTKSAGNLAFDDVAVICGAPTFALSTGTITGAPFCVGQGVVGQVAVSVPYTVSGGSFGTGNVFTAYLSKDGLFTTSKIAIGSVTGVSSGTISGTISQVAGLNTGSAYRIRVEPSSPTTPVGSDNGTNLAVSSYLDNEATVATALGGNTTATVSFTAPANCADNVIVTIRSGGTKSGKPTLTLSNYPVGSALGGGTVVYNGPATGTATATGLTNETLYAFGVFTTNGDGSKGYSDGVQRTVRPIAPATLTEVILPQYISGHAVGASTHTTRLPYVYRATIGGLKPNYFYKFYNSAVDVSVDGASGSGAGNPIYVSPAGALSKQTTAALSSGTTFQADASGNYTAWFGLDPTGNVNFDDQKTVQMRIVLNIGATDAATATADNTEQYFLTTTSGVQVKLLGTATTQATGVRGSSFGTAKNIVLAYNNTSGTGRPLSASLIENDGLDATSFATFYSTSVDAVAGAYGLLTPNGTSGASGIRYVEQRGVLDALPVGCASTDADGVWPGGANTVSPSGGTTALVLTSGDTPFAAPTVLEDFSPTSTTVGSTLTINGTNFTTGPRPTVSFNGGATAVATGTSAITLTVVVPVGAVNGPLSVITSCGTATTIAEFTVTPNSFYTKATGDVNVLGTYGSNSDGSGTVPGSFTAANQTFTINGTNRAFNTGNFVVSGTNSKVVLGTNASLIIPTTGTFTGTLDQNAGSTLIVQSPTQLFTSTTLKQGVRNATSTIELAQTGTYTVPTTLLYKNLKLSNGTKRLDYTVYYDIVGNLTFDNVTISSTLLNSSSNNVTDYAIFRLTGNLTHGTNVSYDATRSITLQLMNTSTAQVLDGNGSTISLYRLTAATGAIGGTLTGTGSTLALGNSVDGGLDLPSSTTALALDGGTTFSLVGGGNFFTSNSGVLKPNSGANLSFVRTVANTYDLGFMKLASGFTTVNDFTLNATSSTSANNLLTLSSDLTIAGTTTLQAGALVISGNTLALNGPLASGAGLLTGSTNSNLSVGGAGSLAPLSFTSGSRLLKNLTLNRTGGSLTLGTPVQMSGLLTLTDGVIITTATNLLTLTTAASVSASTATTATSFVNGPLARATASGARTVLFPIGKGTAYRPLTLNTSAQTGTTTYQAEQFESNAFGAGLSSPDANGKEDLARVSTVRYFTVTPTTGQPSAYQGTITLSIGTNDGVNNPQYPTLVVAKRANASQRWANYGHTASSGVGTGGGTATIAGTVTSDIFTSFSDFALGATNTNTFTYSQVNPLPVELTGFTAERQTAGVQLHWATATEKNNDRFEVQRSLDGQAFSTISTVAGHGSSAQTTTYASLDRSAPAIKIYYRLRQVDQDGKAVFSPVLSVNGTALSLSLFPNPAHSTLSFQNPTTAPLAYRVLNQLGQVVREGVAPAGVATLEVTDLATGSYLLELQTGSGRVVRKFQKE